MEFIKSENEIVFSTCEDYDAKVKEQESQLAQLAQEEFNFECSRLLDWV